MSDVVLRCPACGTTQSHTGECEACYDGTVRYFCTNHTPGIWLDAAQCNECGARFGETSRKPRTPSPAAAAAARGSSRAPDRPEPSLSSARGPRVPRATRRPPPGPEDTRTARPSMADLLARVLAERHKRAADREAGEAWGTPKPELPVLRLGGCLMRFIFIALFLLVLTLAGSFLFIGSVLQFFGWQDTPSGRLVVNHQQVVSRRWEGRKHC